MGNSTAADYKNHPKYIHHHYIHLDGVRPWSVLSRLIFSSEFLPFVFVHLIHISALFLSSCCRSFFLRVVDNLLCIFSVSRQPVLLTSLPQFLHSVVVKMMYPAVLLKIFIPNNVNGWYTIFLKAQISLPYRKMRKASELYIYINGKSQWILYIYVKFTNFPHLYIYIYIYVCVCMCVCVCVCVYIYIYI